MGKSDLEIKKQDAGKTSLKTSTRRQFIKNTLVGTTALGLGAGGLIMHRSTYAAERNTISLTGVWQIHLTPLFNPEQNWFESLDKELVLHDRDGVLAGFWWIYHVRGRRVGKKVSLKIFEPGEIDGVIQSASVEGKFEVEGSKLLINGTFTMSSSTPGVSGISLSNFFAERTANDEATILKKISENQQEVESVDPSKICHWLDLNKILDNVITDITDDIDVVPMDVCDPSKNGGGYYVFGDTGPGYGRSYATATIYYPLELKQVLCKSRTYDFKIKEDGRSKSLNELLEVLEAAEDLLKALKLDISDLVKMVQDFFDEFGDFAFCSGVSTNTFRTSLYVVVSKASVDCDAVKNTPLVKAIKKVLGDVGGRIYCGYNIRDTFSLKRGLLCDPIPLESGPAVSALVFNYWLGTLRVRFD